MSGGKLFRRTHIHDVCLLAQQSLQVGESECGEWRPVGERFGAGAIDFGVLKKVTGAGWQIRRDLPDKLIATSKLKSIIGQALGADGGRTFRTHAATTERSRTMRRIHQRRIGEAQDFLVQTVIEQSSQFLWRMRRGQIGTPHVANEERVAG